MDMAESGRSNEGIGIGCGAKGQHVSIDRIRIGILTNLTATARKAYAVVADMPWIHNAAVCSLGESAGCDLNLGVPTSVLVKNLRTVKNGFWFDSIGL